MSDEITSNKFQCVDKGFTTLLCSIFLPVLVKAISCIGEDLGMFTVAYASLTVQLYKDAYTSKTRAQWMNVREFGFYEIFVSFSTSLR